MYKSIDQMIKDRSWTRPNSYMGPDHNDTIAIIGRSRDSELLEQSNFDVALERLGGESKHVEVVRDSHWACGWIEQIRVSKTHKPTLKIALDILNSLADYSVLDDGDYFERERERINEDFEQYRGEFRRNAIKAFSAATDVPLEILQDTLERSEAFEVILSGMYEEACAYSGYQDAFVSEDNAVEMYLTMCRENFANSDVNNLVAVLNVALGAK